MLVTVRQYAKLHERNAASVYAYVNSGRIPFTLDDTGRVMIDDSTPYPEKRLPGIKFGRKLGKRNPKPDKELTS